MFELKEYAEYLERLSLPVDGIVKVLPVVKFKSSLVSALTNDCNFEGNAALKVVSLIKPFIKCIDNLKI